MKTTQKTQTTAQKIKAAIKAAGIPTKNISVKTSYPGYEEVITITVKDVSINLEDVKKIARPFESIDYDERCQEVLQGGNTFVRVSYDYTAKQEHINALTPAAADLVRAVNNNPTESRFTYIAPNGVTIYILTFTNSDHWAVYSGENGYNNIDHRRSVSPYDYTTPEYFAAALASAFFSLGARYVDNIPAPSNDFYIVQKVGTDYEIAASCPGLKSAENCAADCVKYDLRLDYDGYNPIYYIVTAAEVLAMADRTGIHYPKAAAQPTPAKIKRLIADFAALTIAG